ncbi:MAG: hypothetical protein K5657_03630 [Desulfovibrio sp.]|nr:hypothetical protein [Desulfovibrio sp.]
MPEHCLLHANCQGAPLRDLLLSHPDFARRFTVRHVVNYVREPITQEELDRTSLYLYQYLGPHFNDYSTASFLARLPAKTMAVPIPNMFFKGYWPFWFSAPHLIDFADSVLEDLFARALEPHMIHAIYCKGRLEEFDGVEKTAMDSLAIEREKERSLPVSYTGVLEEYWQEEMLFYTVNHPAVRLTLHVADAILSLLGFSPLPPRVKTQFRHPDAEFCVPVHPEVGRRLGLSFTGKNVTYPLFGSRHTHAEFVSAYIACRLHGVTNLPAFLREWNNGEHAQEPLKRTFQT